MKMENEMEAKIIGTKFEIDKPLDINDIETFAKDLILKQGQVKPQYFVDRKLGKNKYERTTLILVFGDDKEKDELLRHVREVVQGERCIVMAESWVSKRDLVKIDMPFIRPRLDVNRKEAIIITEYNKDMTPGHQIHLFFNRDKEGKITTFEKTDLGKLTMESLWNPYLEYDGVRENMDSGMKKMNEDFFKKVSNDMAKKYAPKLMNTIGEEEQQKVLAEMFAEMDDIKAKIRQQMLEDVEEDEK